MATRTTTQPEVLEARRLLSAAPPLAGAKDADLAYDASGTLHLAFYEAAGHDLRYASRSPAGDWSEAIVIDSSSPDVGAQVSLAVDAAGRPGLAYRDVANADLKYAHLGEGGAWIVQTVEAHRRADTGVLPSLAFDASNKPIISYYRPAGRRLRLATVARGKWRVRNLARVGGPEHAASGLAVNAETGAVGVAYERGNGAVRYSEVSHGKVRTKVVDRLQAAGARPSIAFDSEGHPAFSYYDVANADVKLARRDDAGWSVSLVADTDGRGAGSMLLVEPGSDAIEVVFRDPGGATSVASGTLEAVSFEVRRLGGAGTRADDEAPEPVVVRDPTGHTLVAAFAGGATDIVSTLPPVAGLTALGVSTDSVELGWSDAAPSETGYEVQRSDDGGLTFETIATLDEGATTARFTDLVEAHAYAFRVVTCDAAGNRATSAPLLVTTLPAAATGVSAHALGGGRVEVTWHDNSTGEDGYVIERRAGGADAAWSHLATLDADTTRYVDETIAGAAFGYRVVALRGGDRNPGTSVAAVAVSASAPPPAPPPAPARLAAPGAPTATPVSASKLHLSWADNSSAEAGYQVQWCVDGKPFRTYRTLGANATQITVKGLAGGSTYRFRVRARAGSTGAKADSAFATTPEFSVAPAAPTDLSAVALGDGGKIDLHWTDPRNNRSRGFKIDRSSDGETFAEVASVSAGVTQFVDDGLTPSTSYIYRVAAVGDWGTTDYSNVAIESGADLSPTGVDVRVVSQTRVDVAWQDNCPRETEYVVRYSDGSRTLELTRPANSTSATLTGLAPGVDYTVQVVARLAGGEEWASSIATSVMLIAPADLSVSVGDAEGNNLSSAVTLTWTDPNTGEGGYVVERSEDGGRTFSFLDTVGAGASTYTDATVPEDTTYVYRVYAYNTNGVGAVSAGVPNVPATWLHAPGSLEATPAGPWQIDLRWVDNSGAETQYKIAMSSDGQVYYEVGAVDSRDEMAFAVHEDMFGQPLTPGATYWFKVMAVNGDNASGWSEPASATTPV